MAIQSIERAAQILGLFSLNRIALGVTEIANELGLGISTVHASSKRWLAWGIWNVTIKAPNIV